MSMRNASISIAISEDGLSAVISDWSAAQEGGALISSSGLNDALRQAGVITPPLVGVLTKINTVLKKGEDPRGITVARGTLPEPAKDAALQPAGDFRMPVFPGDVIGTITPARSAAPGKGVNGTVVKSEGPEKGQEISFAEDCGCHLDTTTLQVRASRYGIIGITRNRIHMRPLIAVTPDAMVAMGSVFARDFKGREVTPLQMESALKAEDITQPLETAVLQAALKNAQKSNAEIPNVPLSRGVQPQSGKDGWFELYIKDERSSIGIEAADGSIDFRARGMIKAVTSGTKLGKLHAPTRGRPGKDVFGKLIPAHDGAVFLLQTGEHVDALEGSEFAAAIEGMVIYKNNSLSVSEVFQTRGDLNMSVGNISLEKGSAHIRGAVLAGFRVSAPRHVRVDDIVENAEIECGGDVEIGAGILMDRTGFIKAGGTISATFAKGARLESGADIIIAHELSNCTVFAAGSVEAVKGRGKIVGGEVHAVKNILANEVGSDLGVLTTIILGTEPQPKDNTRSARRKELNSLIERIDAGLGQRDLRTLLEQTPPEKRPAVASVIKTRIAAQEELRALDEEEKQEKERLLNAPKPRLKVLKTLYPGTSIKAGGLTLCITDPVPYSQIYFDPQAGEIVIASL